MLFAKIIQNTNIMSTINLLKGSINGKLGELYGTKQYRNCYLKAIPFSHAPHNEKQNQAFSAFQKLVRFSGGVAKVFKTYLPIETKKQTATNAVTQLFKPIIKNKSFNINYLEDVIVADGAVSIKSFGVNYETNQIFLDVSTTDPINKTLKSVLFIGIFDDTGKMIKTFVPDVTEVSGFFSANLEQGRTYGVVAFRSDFDGKKQKLHGLALRLLQYIIDGYLNIDAFPTQENYSIVDEVLNINDETVTVVEEYLNIIL